MPYVSTQNSDNELKHQGSMKNPSTSCTYPSTYKQEKSEQFCPLGHLSLNISMWSYWLIINYHFYLGIDTKTAQTFFSWIFNNNIFMFREIFKFVETNFYVHFYKTLKPLITWKVITPVKHHTRPPDGKKKLLTP